MNKLIIAISLLFLSLSSYSQTNQDSGTNQQKEKKPVVIKGYYSIGNNAEKLSQGTSLLSADDKSLPSVQKGYYAIGNNNEKLKKQRVIKTGSKSVPVIKKGYYSIGNNAEKL